MSRPVPRLLLAALLSLLVLVAAAPAAQAATYGSTSLTIDEGVADALSAEGFTATAGGGATADPEDATTFRFPVADSLAAALFRGLEVRHTGTLTIDGAGASFTFSAPVVDVFARQLTAAVGGTRVPLFDLDFTNSETRFTFAALTLGPVTGTLTTEAAAALNATFSTDAFTKGLVFASASVEQRLFPSRG